MQVGWSVAILMIAMGGLGVSGVGTQQRPSVVGWILAGVLVAAGAALFLRRSITFWLAIAAAGALALSGVVALAGHRQLSLPMPPALSLVVGLYLVLRLMMAKKQLLPKP